MRLVRASFAILWLAACDGGENQPTGDDADQDGIPTASDCDDNNAQVGEKKQWYVDQDGDGIGGDKSAKACVRPAGLVAKGGDCDETDENNWESCGTCLDQDADEYWVGCDAYTSIKGPDCADGLNTNHPGGSEVCDDQDNDCDDDRDEGLANCACADNGTATTESCNGVDDDCDETIDNVTDAAAECNTRHSDPPQVTAWACHAGACTITGCATDYVDLDDDPETGCECQITNSGTEICDGLDNDCDGNLLVDEIDADQDGSLACAGDCDDDDPNNWLACDDCQDQDDDGAYVGCDAYVTFSEDCDDLDDNNWTPAGCTNCADQDGDGFSAACDTYVTLAQDCNDDDPNNWLACTPCEDNDGDGAFVGCDAYVTFREDCDDDNPLTFLDAAERCDNEDNDCDEEVDEGLVNCPCTGGGSPDTEICDGIDNDCDGVIDNVDCAAVHPTAQNVAAWACIGGACAIRLCAPGKANTDDTASTGCEADCVAGGAETCDGVDSDCDGDLELDADGDGQQCDADCDDTDPNNWSSCGSCGDEDGDGFYGDCDAFVTVGEDCSDTDGNNWLSCTTCVDGGDDAFKDGCDAYRDSPRDCDNGDGSIYPGADEIPNDGTDQDCDGIDYTPPVFAGLEGLVVERDTEITLSWSAATDDATTAANILYQIFVARGTGRQNFGRPNHTITGQTTFALPALAGNDHHVVVRACDELGSCDSNTVERFGHTPTVVATWTRDCYQDCPIHINAQICQFNSSLDMRMTFNATRRRALNGAFVANLRNYGQEEEPHLDSHTMTYDMGHGIPVSAWSSTATLISLDGGQGRSCIQNCGGACSVACMFGAECGGDDWLDISDGAGGSGDGQINQFDITDRPYDIWNDGAPAPTTYLTIHDPADASNDQHYCRGPACTFDCPGITVSGGVCTPP